MQGVGSTRVSGMDLPWLHESNSRAQGPRCLPSAVEFVEANGGVVSVHSREKMDKDLDTRRLRGMWQTWPHRDLLLRTHLKPLVAVFRSEAAAGYSIARVGPGRIKT